MPQIEPDQFRGPFDAMQQAGEPLGARWRSIRGVEIAPHFREQQSIDPISEGQDDCYCLQKGAHQSLIHTCIQFHEQRGQKPGQRGVQSLCHLRCIIRRNWQIFDSCEIL